MISCEIHSDAIILSKYRRRKLKLTRMTKIEILGIFGHNYFSTQPINHLKRSLIFKKVIIFSIQNV